MTALDNPIWNALAGRQKDFSLGDDGGRRFKSQCTSLVGFPQPDEAAFDSLGQIMTVGEKLIACSLIPLEVPDNWAIRGAFPGAQMVCEKLLPCRPQQLQQLTDADIPAMSELATLTQPGPFASRTIDFGTFYGIKDGDRLAAMAGERLKVDGGYDEVSAVCTHPDYQGKGMARALVYAVAKNIIDRGHTPFLHVRSENLAGIRSYQSIGFVERCQVYFSVLEKLG